MPAPLTAEMSAWNGLASGTSVKSWLAQATGTAITVAARSPTTVSLAQRGRSRRKRGQRTSIWIFMQRTPLSGREGWSALVVRQGHTQGDPGVDPSQPRLYVPLVVEAP